MPPNLNPPPALEHTDGSGTRHTRCSIKHSAACYTVPSTGMLPPLPNIHGKFPSIGLLGRAWPLAKPRQWMGMVRGRKGCRRKENPALHMPQLPVSTAWINIGFPVRSASQLSNAWCKWPKQRSEKKSRLFHSATKISISRNERKGVTFSPADPPWFSDFPTADTTPLSFCDKLFTARARGPGKKHDAAAPAALRQQGDGPNWEGIYPSATWFGVGHQLPATAEEKHTVPFLQYFTQIYQDSFYQESCMFGSTWLRPSKAQQPPTSVGTHRGTALESAHPIGLKAPQHLQIHPATDTRRGCWGSVVLNPEKSYTK